MLGPSIIVDLLNQSAKYTADFLTTYLANSKYDWWQMYVYEHLPESIKRNYNFSNPSLYELDTYALLKVFDGNWRMISEKARLEYVMRNYLKELLVIRNEWAHQATYGIPAEKIERHLSTIYYYNKGIKADDEFLQRIQKERLAVLNEQYSTAAPQTTEEKAAPTPTTTPETTSVDNDAIHQPGTLIRLKSDSTKSGAVISVSTTGKEPRYTVLINNKKQTYYHSQILAEETYSENPTATLEEFNAHLTVTQLSNPYSQSLFSLNSAKINIIPHQFRPVLKFIKAERPRILIADGVGVGKTIEAGLILKELEAREKAKNILIICPKPLVSEKKWSDEMRIRFGEHFKAIDGKEFKSIIDDAAKDEWDMHSYGKIIIPYSLFTEDKLKKNKTCAGLFNLKVKPKFDLVIVDEAHHIRNSNTFAYDAVKYFVDNAEAAVFLTATPIQMDEYDLFTLLNLLRPDLIPDWETFGLISEPNQYVNAAVAEIRSQAEGWMKRAEEALQLASLTQWGYTIYQGNPDYNSVMERLKKPSLTQEERVTLLSDTEALHTFFSILNRTRRRDIGEYTVRKTTTVETPFTPEQAKIYDEVLDLQSEILSVVQPGTPAAFMMNTLQRRAASSLHGLVPYLEGILSSHLHDFDFIEAGTDEAGTDIVLRSLTDKMKERITALLKAADGMPKDDIKYSKMLEILAEKQTQPNNKVMIFSTFRHTLNYLADKLFEDGYRVGVIHGGVKDSDRRYLRDKFKLPKEDEEALDILLFSEVGCEGLDYQFCDCMINYDLPWNPMKVEQRIGRIDRTGQKSESITIFNLITPDTVDAAIYNRCLYRIGIFEQAIGGSDEILGEIAREIQCIAENFRLTEAEKEERLEQLSDNQIRKYCEQQKLEAEQAELFGLELPKQQMEKELEDATSSWLSPKNMENLITVYLQKRLNTESEFIVGDKLSRKLRLNADYRQTILQDFQNLPYKPNYKKWEKWLDGNEKSGPYYPVYFDSEHSSDGDGDQITLCHPLVKQAMSFFDPEAEISTVFTINDADIPAGRYPFAVYLWNFLGIYRNQDIIPVCKDSKVSERLYGYFKSGTSLREGEGITDEEKENLEDVHYELWSTAEMEHRLKTVEFINRKIQSLKRSYGLREARLMDLIDSATDENIIRMRNDELKKVRIELQKKIDELEAAKEMAELEARPVGYGIVEVQ